MDDVRRANSMQKSDEGDAKGLALGRAEGEAIGRTLRHMIEDVADDGREIEHGEYLIAYAVEKAEGMYVPRDGKLEWQEPEDENVHIEIAVRDKADGRFIPGLDVEVTVVDAEGDELGTHKMPLLWHPYLYHYGRNWHVPAAGTYSLRVHVATPQFPRHDKANGKRFLKGALLTFDDVEIETGQD